ncbi:MAG: DUF3576 domain-containing protein [Alphaproteobacteria bacterium]
MTALRFAVFMCFSFVLVSCSTPDIKSEPSYPKGDTGKRREKVGTITNNEKGITLFGPGKDDRASSEDNGIGVNAYLWKATLDTVSFMPIASADPFGGVIITDWYSMPKTPNERFKINAFITSKSLQANGIKVTVFHQKRTDKQTDWADQTPNTTMATQMEDAILTRARERKVDDEQNL